MKKATIELARRSIEKACSTHRNNPEIYLEKRIKKVLKTEFTFQELQNFIQNPVTYYPLTLLPASTSNELQSLYKGILQNWGFDSQFESLTPDWLRLKFKLIKPFEANTHVESKAFYFIQEALQTSEINSQNNWWIVNQFWEEIDKKIESEDYMIDIESETMIIDFRGNLYRSCIFEPSRFQLLQTLAFNAGFSSCKCTTNTLRLKV